MGENIGSEIVGKGDHFSRPILILSKVYGHSCIALPLTSQNKEGSYYHTFKDTMNNEQCALLPQVKYLDGKRIREKISSVSQETLLELQEQYFMMIKNSPSKIVKS